MRKEEEKYPIDKRFRIKNSGQQEKLKKLRSKLKESEETRKDSDQATFELMLDLADQRRKQIEKENRKLAEAMP